MPSGAIEVHVSGQKLNATALDAITTPTGRWPVADLGAVEGGHAYRFKLDSRPEWWSFCIVRYAALSSDVREKIYSVAINGVDVKMSVLGGSMRCLDNGEPIAPDMNRLRAAVDAKRVVPYRSAAFTGFPVNRTLTTSDKPAYNVARIYGVSNSNNSIGVVSGQGGEYDSSRGFLAERDAVMIAAAMAGDGTAFNAAARQVRGQMLYGLSLPNLAIWSQNHNMLRDPQQPLPGDTIYVNEGNIYDNYGGSLSWTAPSGYPYLAEIGATAGQTYPHGRDIAHLFNHAYAYWLATGDPRAAILQQAIGAYALAGSYQGGYGDGRYRSQFNYQRMMLNPFSALWKARDVAANISTENGQMFWPKARVDKMVADIYSDWQDKIAALDASGDAKKRMMSAFRAYDETESYSKFMGQAYGPEAAYLFASIGKGGLLTRLAENMVIRAGDIGGTRGVDGDGGSTILQIDGSATTKAAIITKLNALSSRSNVTFNDAETHYVIRAYWLLRMAQDAVARGWIAPITGLDAAIIKMESARAATSNWKWADITSWKHAATSF